MFAAIDWQIFFRIGLARLGRRDDEAALALADGAHDVDGATGDGILTVLHLELLIGVDGRKVAELGALARFLGIEPVHRLDLRQAGELIAGARGAKRSLDKVAGAQAGSSDEVRRNECVVAAGHVAVGADMAEALVRDIENAGNLAEAFCTGIGHVDFLNKLGLLLARDVEIQFARFLAELGDLHGRKIFAREAWLDGRVAVIACFAILLTVASIVALVVSLGVRAMRTLVALSARCLALLGSVRSIGALGRALICGRLAGIGSLRLGAGRGSFPRRGGVLSCSGGLGRGLVRRGPALSRRTLRTVGCSAAGTAGAMVFHGRRTLSGIGGCGSFRPLVPRSGRRLRRRKRCGCGAFRLDVGLGLPAAAVRAKRRVDGRGCRHGSVICCGGRRCICSSLVCVTGGLLGPLRGAARLGRSLCGLARLHGIARKRRLSRGSRSSIGRIRRLLGAARPRGLSGGRQRFLRASGGAALLANDRRLRDLRQGARLRDLGRHFTGRRLRGARRVRLARSGC